MRTLLDQYLRWLAWEQDVTDQVIESLRAVTAEERGSDAWQRAGSILGHLLAARQIWLFRLGVSATKTEGLFPAVADLDSLQRDFRTIMDAWKKYLGSLNDDSALDVALEYQSLDGGRFRSTLADILAQLNTHGSYHRGQLAMLVKQCGGTPAITDYVYWSRERL